MASYRYPLPAIAISVTTLLVLSACQPITENSESTVLQNDETTTIEEVVAPSTQATEQATKVDETIDGHAGHHMPDAAMSADDVQMSDMLKDYSKSMARMHDEMMIGMNYNDPDTAFAKGMLGHHRGALDMAKTELKYGTDETMRKLAQDIIDSQQVEIDTINKWLASHPDAAKPKPDTQAMQQAYAKGMETMHGEMTLGIADPMPDMAFARGMLPHHIGAVDMAMVQMKYGKDTEMRQLAQQIIDTQQREIELMQDWIALQEIDNNELNQ
ncbi:MULTISPECIES: CopM family metallochaperone [unclassified Psychrobacter]|uniref:CopM family metallochaperone n=1 Tax=unclassified Psychrobacter TaxID=196806 RepID=UPI003F485986